MVEKTPPKLTKHGEFCTVFLTMSVKLALPPLFSYNFLTFDLAFYVQTQKLELSCVIFINFGTELVMR